jgi:UDPglucose 6-dehydrogenase/GDP-mannose 6-dehydrogenase
MKVAVIGVGYVGAVSAAGLAAEGHTVDVFDIERERALALCAGRPTLHEPGLRELVATAGDRLRAPHTLEEALRDTRVALICVQTPAAPDGAIDLSFVEAAVRDIVAAATAGPLVVVLRSTVVPGTTARVDRTAFAPARARGLAIEAAANPEFLREGRAVPDFLHPDRVVIGTLSARAVATLRELYSFSAAPLVELTPASAELAKYASNALLATLISFSNELADVAETIEGADVVDVLRVLHTDRRWHETEGLWVPGLTRYLWPGSGYGGSCLPKDVKALVAEARRRGVDAALLAAVDRINEARAAHLSDRIAALVPLGGTRVAVLGTAFKEGTTDTRSSPGAALAQELERRGARVVSFDPIAPRDAARSASSLDEALTDARVWVVVTGAAEFIDLPRRALASQALVVDARRRYDILDGARYLGPGAGPDRR